MSSSDVCIIDYGMGNLMSVLRAFELIGCSVTISNKIEDIEESSRIVMPGVGAFSAAMDNLRSLNIIEALTKKVIVDRVPFLGICLGMQLIAQDSYEHGHYEGLGWIPANVVKLESGERLRVPHMGWSEIEPIDKPESIFNGVEGDKSFYFVHSYHVQCFDEDYIGSLCNYGQSFVSSLQYGNIYATQFHPEKSQKNGIQLLKNFIAQTS
jgi:glutamine amidotransferase